jgi:hypothetical protein
VGLFLSACKSACMDACQSSYSSAPPLLYYLHSLFVNI